MTLKPFDIAKEIMEEISGPSPEDPRERAKLALSNNGATIEDVARAIGDGLNDDDQRIQASKLALEIHGVITNDKRVSLPVVNISIVGSDRTLLQLISPRG